MLFQLLLDVIAFLIKILLWVVVAVAAIPVGIFYLLNEVFPVFTHDGGFWFWAVLGTLSLAGFIVLWKPILWVSATMQALLLGSE
jgi:hypothetical protein